MTLNSKGLALILALIIAVITTTALYLTPNVPDRAIFLTFILSFISGFSIIRVMAELLFFKESNNIYKALENGEREWYDVKGRDKLISDAKKQVSEHCSK